MDKGFKAHAYRTFNLKSILNVKLFIKNMVCPRCILSVEQIFRSEGIPIKKILLGEVESEEHLSVESLEKLSVELIKVGFEILDDAKAQLIDRIKNLLIQKIQEESIEPHFSLNKFLSGKLFKEYSTAFLASIDN